MENESISSGQDSDSGSSTDILDFPEIDSRVKAKAKKAANSKEFRVSILL